MWILKFLIWLGRSNAPWIEVRDSRFMKVALSFYWVLPGNTGRSFVMFTLTTDKFHPIASINVPNIVNAIKHIWVLAFWIYLCDYMCQMLCVLASVGLEDKYVLVQNIAFLCYELAKPIWWQHEWIYDMTGLKLLNSIEEVHCRMYVLR